MPKRTTTWIAVTSVTWMIGALLALPTTASADATPVEDALTLVSTPDEPFVGGRAFDMTQDGADIVTPDKFWAAFRRTDTWSAQLKFDPYWVVEMDPSIAAVGATVPLDRDSTLFRLGRMEANANGWRDGNSMVWFGEACPDMTGEVEVTSIQTDGTGAPTSLAASFTLHCTPDSSVFGSVAYYAVQPDLPAAAESVISLDREYPRLPVPGVRGEDDPALAIKFDADRAYLRWDSPLGFSCAVVDIYPRDTIPTDHTYVGQDDSTMVGWLDPDIAYQVDIAFGRSSDADHLSCDNPIDFDNRLIQATSVNVDPVDAVPAGDESRVRGSVRFHANGLDPQSWPAPDVRVQLWGSLDGEDTLLETTRADAAGRFHFDVELARSTDAWAVVPAGTVSPSALTHFGGSSDRVAMKVNHRVRAWATDPTVPTTSSVSVFAQLQPGDDTVPLFLERKSRDGNWVRVDMKVTEPGQTTKLELANVRRGWQAVRVVAPNDGWHGRDVSNHVRIFGY